MGYEPIVKGYQIGLYVGQMVEHCAIVLTELQLRDYRRYEYPGGEAWEHGKHIEGGDIHYVVRHSEQLPLRTSYTKVIQRLSEVYHRIRPSAIFKPTPMQELEGRLVGRLPRKRPDLHFQTYVDISSVGQPVAEAIQETDMDINRVLLSGGEKEVWNGSECRLSNIVLISRMQFNLQNGHVHLPNSTPDEIKQSQAVVNALENFEIKVNDQNVRIGVFKEGASSALAIALGLACWPMRDNNLYIEYLYPGDPLYEVLYGRR